MSGASWAARLAAAGLIVSTTVAGCRDAAVHDVAVPLVFDLNVDAAAGVSEITPGRADVLGADQLRGLLDHELAWHLLTLVESMRAARSGDPDAQSWIDKLVDNTEDLTAAVGLVYGPTDARAFNQQWAQHTQFLVDYAVAIGAGNDADADEAKDSLDDYAHDSGSFFETALDGELSADAVSALLAQHISDMISMIESDNDGDDGTAADTAANDSVVLSDVAAALSGAIAAQQPTAFPGSTETRQANFCTIVTQKSSAYLATLLITGDPSSAAVRNAESGLTTSTGVEAAVVVGLTDGLPTGGNAAIADATGRALDHAVEYGSTSPPVSRAARADERTDYNVATGS